jgi:hypothetical protein
VKYFSIEYCQRKAEEIKRNELFTAQYYYIARVFITGVFICSMHYEISCKRE